MLCALALCSIGVCVPAILGRRGDDAASAISLIQVRRTHQRASVNRSRVDGVKDPTDYREDARAFRRNNLMLALSEGSLKRVDAAYVDKVFASDNKNQARFKLASALFEGPGLVDGVMAGWSAPQRWGARALEARLSHVSFDPQHFEVPGWVISNERDEIHLSEYLHQPQPYGAFLFEKGYNARHPAIDMLRNDSLPRPPWACNDVEGDILAIDAIGSSHGFHFHEPVWQTQVIGRKAWWLLPPESDSVPVDEIPEILYAPTVGNKTYFAPNACAFLQRQKPPPEATSFVVGPGETLLLPSAWWHATCALDDYTIAIGGWLDPTICK